MSHTDIKRLRMFAGPNGSGKSSLVRRYAREFSPNGVFSLGHYINADDLLRDLGSNEIAVDTFGIEATWEQVRESLISTRRLAADHPFLESAQVQNSRLTAHANICDAYVAASIADFLHEQLLARGVSFSFETVMSHPSKVQLFGRARANEYRTYL